jgi:patatin-related protein
MREKELRIALVCFGGISLAVYMHGISKEILKLVRASRALHAIPGGINGTMLARALCHDLPMNPLRKLWLENADVSVLLSSEARAGNWSKWILKPLIWAAAATGQIAAFKDLEVRQKLSLFVRSRWFQPPLDGHAMARLMYDGITSMGEGREAQASLIPTGQSLDLFIALTDFHGYPQQVQIHDPSLIHELEHRHILQFRYRRHPGGEVESDFQLDNAGALAFAARATSSFPGAFPPARIVEMDEVLAERHASWPRRAAFLASSFVDHIRAGIDPTTASFIDGSVLNNRPFQEAIGAIHGRPAYREVDRRLIYIDPHPPLAPTRHARGVPGFFTTLRGALSDIPSSQPVTEDLNRVVEFNEQVRRVRAIIDSARPHVSELVGKVVTSPFDGALSAQELRRFREQVNAQVAVDAGFAYQAYVRLKLTSVRAFGAELIVNLRGVAPQSPLARVVARVIDLWAVRRGIVFERADSRGLEFEDASAQHIAAWVQYLLAFDVKYRVRRLHFLIEGQNRLYLLIEQKRLAGFDPRLVDRLKRQFYDRLEAVRRRENAEFYSEKVRELVATIFPASVSSEEIKHIDDHARRFVAERSGDIDQLIDCLAGEIDLSASTRELDELLASLDPAEWHPQARREVLINYLGFPFWDVLTLPITSAREIGELREILIDRISPDDAHTLNGLDGGIGLKGIGFGHFAAFLSRAYRENDYLLGRLHALDRLIDIVCDAAGIDPANSALDLATLRQRGFMQILDAEEKFLTHSSDLIAALRKAVAGIKSREAAAQ